MTTRRTTTLIHGREYLCYREGDPNLLLRWHASAEVFAPSLQPSKLDQTFPPDAFDGVVAVDEAVKKLGRKIRMEAKI